MERHPGPATILRLNLERRRVEFESFLEHAPIGLHWIGPDGRIIWANRAELELTGYAKDEYFGQLISKFHVDGGIIDGLLRRVTAGEVVRETEAALRCKGGRTRHVLIDGNGYFENGRFIHARFYTRDVTALKEARNELRTADRPAKNEGDAEKSSTDAELCPLTIEDLAGFAIIALNPEGYVQSWNDGAALMNGYTSEEITGLHVSTFFLPTAVRRRVPDRLLRNAAAKGKAELEDWAVRKDGTQYWAHIDVTALRNAEGVLDGFVKVVRDMTDRRYLERAAADSVTHERFRLGSALDEGINQHLTGAALMAKALERKLSQTQTPGAETALELVRILSDVQTRLRILVKGVRPVEVDANGLSSALAELAVRTHGLADVRCVFESPEPVPIRNTTEAAELYYIAEEAVANATKHANATNVIISLRGGRGRVSLHVRDDGTGFDEELESATGLGIRMMRYRAGLIGARLNIQRAETGGTLVSCTLEMEDDHGG